MFCFGKFLIIYFDLFIEYKVLKQTFLTPLAHLYVVDMIWLKKNHWNDDKHQHWYQYNQIFTEKSRNRNNSHRFQVCLSSFIFLLYCYHYLHFALHYSVPETRRLLHYSVPGTRRLLHFYWCSCYLIFSFLCNVL